MPIEMVLLTRERILHSLSFCFLLQHLTLVYHVHQGPTPASMKDLLLSSTSPNPNTSKQKEENKSNSSHKMIIHIGPSKTATTTIQKFAATFSDQLAQDNYLYLGRYADKSVRKPAKATNLLRDDECLRQVKKLVTSGTSRWQKEASLPECWNQRIAYILKVDKNILLSDEAYSYPYNAYMRNQSAYFEAIKVGYRNWNITMVATYRHYFEWVISVAKEKNRKNCNDINTLWPQDGGLPCQRIFDLADEMKQRDDYGFAEYANLDRTLPAWKAAGFPVKVLSMHSARSVVEEFYCGILGETPSTCEHASNEESHYIYNSNSIEATIYNDIVYAASLKNLTDQVQRSKSRHEMAQELLQFAKASNTRTTQLPLICPSDDWMDSLLNKSLSFQQLILPNSDHRSSTEHRRSFRRIAEKGKVFCWVNTDQLLKNIESWDCLLDRIRKIGNT